MLATCTDSAAGPTCGPCPSGYTGTGATACVDVDECQTGNGGCPSGSACHNTAGSHTCDGPDAGSCSPTCTTGTCCGGACVDTQTSLTDCGGCAQACQSSTDHTVAQCAASSCRVSCEPGFFDCDGDPSNGCEANVACACAPGATVGCYDGALGTEDVGPCHGGMKTCLPSGLDYGACRGEVTPVAEICADNIDQDCNGTVDDVPDVDGDGFTTCTGDCCELPGQCANPALVNPGAFDVPGNQVDDDCNGVVDDRLTCDRGLATNSASSDDAARALGLCAFTTQTSMTPGVLSTSLTLSSGVGTPAPASHSLQPAFGANNPALEGSSLLVLSTGLAAPTTDPMAPASMDFGETSTLPAQFQGVPPTPTCPMTMLGVPHDPVMLTLTLRVPTNAHGFALKANYLTGDYVGSVCSPYVDQFVVLISPASAPNPLDGNLAIVGPTHLGINGDLAATNSGYLTQCAPSPSGCPVTYSACTTTAGLTGTGFDLPGATPCDPSALRGAGTGWLTISGAATPGSQLTLRLAIWDSGDGIIDSTVLLDAFQWLETAPLPGATL